MHVNSICAITVGLHFPVCYNSMVIAYIKICTRFKIKYIGRSVTHIPVWSEQFWANYCPIFPIGIFIIIVLLLLILYTLRPIGSWWGNRRERDHWGDLGVDGWIILGQISRRWDVGM